MSDQFTNFTGPLKKEVVDEIEKLNLSTLQKLHLKLLSHCLEVLKDISLKADNAFPDSIHLQIWCDSEAKKFNDEKFSELLFTQMNLASGKLKAYAEKIGKYPFDLNLDDLVDLTSRDN
tara:strand:+ start:1380 stop:1736 length:357 start_codon:yes stop_codon:yes gene_type:complete